MKQKNHIENQFIVLGPDMAAWTEPADETLYERLDSTYNNFVGHNLISSYEFESDWPSWEMHPHGDEVVLLISGEMVFILDKESGEQSITLSEQGQYLIVPKGVWHTAKTKAKSKLLFITAGQETQHKGTS